MPLYNYKCTNCGEVKLIARRISERDDPMSCTHCDTTKEMRRIIALSGFQLKGSGWYKDGYK